MQFPKSSDGSSKFMTILLLTFLFVTLFIVLANYRTTRNNNFLDQMSIPCDDDNDLMLKRRKNRIAVLWTGDIRWFGGAFNFMRNLLLAHNEFPDLFIHMYYSHHGEKDYFEQIRPFLKRLVKATLVKFDREAIIKHIQSQYSNFHVFLEECKHHTSEDTCIQWFYSKSQIREAFSYMERHNNLLAARRNVTTYYDLVFRLSPEVIFEARMDLQNFALEPDTFYTSQLYNRGGVNDEIGFGSVQVMNTYSSLILNAEKLANLTSTFHPQLYLKHQLLEKHDVKLIPISYRRIRALEFASHASEIREPFDDLLARNTSMNGKP
ncbi:hypothetical protein C9374_014418 [Naegleria lovaniensis]|uniref:Uncharacterized protein n=1 Tax=Naegleria lovaniensis TaxID=51637 RepID=A0AA88KP41_NAELO|nr:uncharacterized protein C9374_014418 [Naegleria lovaniensis]KAG2389018.1 hypothetical protein C9374_014418 [Naegleria lovaniensis]